MGAEICPQKGLSCTKDSALPYVHHKPYCVQVFVSFQVQEFYQTLHFLENRILLKYQTRYVKNCCTSCFFLSCRFQNMSLKGARTVLPPTSFKCKRRKQSIAETKLKSKISLASKDLCSVKQSTQKLYCHDWLQMEL